MTTLYLLPRKKNQLNSKFQHEPSYEKETEKLIQLDDFKDLGDHLRCRGIVPRAIFTGLVLFNQELARVVRDASGFIGTPIFSCNELDDLTNLEFISMPYNVNQQDPITKDYLELLPDLIETVTTKFKHGSIFLVSNRIAIGVILELFNFNFDNQFYNEKFDYFIASNFSFPNWQVRSECYK